MNHRHTLFINHLFLLIPILVFLTSGNPPRTACAAELENSAVGLVYHRFGEDQYPTTSVTVKQLENHIKELASGPYNVIPLQSAVKKLLAGQKLPARSIVITIDDAFKSFYDVAWPRFREAGLPATVFVSTASIDKSESGYLSWNQLREMRDEGLDIQAHGHHHYHLAGRNAAETKREIETSRNRLKQELGIQSNLFAYPYGEASLTLMKQVEAAGFTAALGQHSGGMTHQSNRWYLPRYPINMRYGEMDGFRQKINSIGLPVTDLLPLDPLLTHDQTTNPPTIGFTIAETVSNLKKLACYHSQTGVVKQIEWLGSRRVEMRFNEKFADGRTRINCTIPASDGRWFWLGMQFYLKPQ